MKLIFTSYVHHDTPVWTRVETQGKHRELCLCYVCGRFKPETPDNCPIAQRIYETCVLHGVVTPVFECPEFVHDAKTQNKYFPAVEG